MKLLQTINEGTNDSKELTEKLAYAIVKAIFQTERHVYKAMLKDDPSMAEDFPTFEAYWKEFRTDTGFEELVRDKANDVIKTARKIAKTWK